MPRITRVRHEFVTYLPEHLEDGVLYIALEFCTMAHRCCCGCGTEIITPLAPTAWQLTFDGESVSLFPSIGNWNLACESHYWIKSNAVTWAEHWSAQQINASREGRSRLQRERNGQESLRTRWKRWWSQI